MPVELFMLLVVVAFVLIGGLSVLYQQAWEPVPEPLRSWLLERTHPGAIEPLVGPHYFIVNTKRRSVRLHQAATRALQRATHQQYPIAIMQNVSNDALLLAKAEALAALIVAKKIGQTEGIKLVFGETASSTNKRYQMIVPIVQAAVARQSPPKFHTPLTDKQRQFRRSAGLPS